MSIATVIRGLFGTPNRPPSDFELADLGLSRVDYQNLISGVPGTRARMEALAAQFGVTPEMIDRDRGTALEIAQVCGHCGHARSCQNALDLGVAFEFTRCPNADHYKTLAAAAD